MFPSAAAAAHRPTPRIVFGTDAIARLPTELSRLQVFRPLLVSSPSCTSLARHVQSLIPRLDCHLTHSTLSNDTIALASGRDAVISVGSACAIEAATVIGTRNHVPHICIPSTYSSAETASLRGAGPGEMHSSGRKERHKRYRRAKGRARPAVIIYDENLTTPTLSITLFAPKDAEFMKDMRTRIAQDGSNNRGFV